MISDAEALPQVLENSVDDVVSFPTLRYVPDPKQALLTGVCTPPGRIGS